MIRSLLLAAALLTGTALSASDARLLTRLYNPDEIVRIEGRTGVQATIAFGPDEHIENVAIGDSASWQVTPNKRANLLFIKPLFPKARTNLTVVTDQHSYFFDLVSSSSGKPLYLLRFSYPEQPGTAAPAGMSPLEAQAASGPAPVDPSALNFAWRSRGSGKLLPARIFDDGNATFIAWSSATPIPAILVRNDEGEEGPVNFAVRGDVIVVEGVPSLIVLRSGRDSATLENRSSNNSKSVKSDNSREFATSSPSSAPEMP
jgi:type IV secretion system protein VirB9